MEHHGRGTAPSFDQISRTATQVLQKIKNGGLDGSLDSIEGAIRARRVAIKADLDAKVKEVYGPDAEIIVPDQKPLEPNTMLCGAELGGVPTCGPASDCPHGAL